MSRRWILAAFAAVCLAQLAVPALMIASYERTLREGRAYRIRCQPVDPADAFRGRYVWIGPVVTAPPDLALGDLSRDGDLWGSTLWAALEVGPDDFARASSISKKRPSDGDVVRVHYAGQGFDPDTKVHGEHRFQLTLDRYYMPESAAPEAERVYREQVQRGTVDAWATVRVRGGVAVIESLHVAGMPIEEFLALPPERRPAPEPAPGARAPRRPARETPAR